MVLAASHPGAASYRRVGVRSHRCAGEHVHADRAAGHLDHAGQIGPPAGQGGVVADRADRDNSVDRAEGAGSGGRADRTAAAWEPPSWDEVVRAHSARVYRLAYRLTGNRHDAEDLTQDVFVRVFRSLADYTPGTFEGWLHRITTNLFLDRVRRAQRIRFDALPEDHDRLPGRERTPDQVYEETHLTDDVQAALDALAPDFRAAVVLCDMEGLSYEEIAATLGVKLGTVRSRIHRGRAQLRDALAHRAPRRPAPGPREAS
jgi:RNA polymerase sigma-70 factor (ECF subfamily)